MEIDDSLWRRVAALRGIQLAKLGERANIYGERFQVQVSRAPERKTPVPELNTAPVVRLVGDPSCQGVIGEIVLEHEGAVNQNAAANDEEATNDQLEASAVADDPPAPTTPLGWRRASIVQEAQRLARVQLERRTRG
jgi:hypothetical protein